MPQLLPGQGGSELASSRLQVERETHRVTGLLDCFDCSEATMLSGNKPPHRLNAVIFLGRELQNCFLTCPGSEICYVVYQSLHFCSDKLKSWQQKSATMQVDMLPCVLIFIFIFFLFVSKY